MKHYLLISLFLISVNSLATDVKCVNKLSNPPACLTIGEAEAVCDDPIQNPNEVTSCVATYLDSSTTVSESDRKLAKGACSVPEITTGDSFKDKLNFKCKDSNTQTNGASDSVK